MSRPIETVLNKLLPPTQIVFKVAVYGTDWEKANHHKKDLVRSQLRWMKTGDENICKMMSVDPKASRCCLFRGWTESTRRQISSTYTWDNLFFHRSGLKRWKKPTYNLHSKALGMSGTQQRHTSRPLVQVFRPFPGSLSCCVISAIKSSS